MYSNRIVVLEMLFPGLGGGIRPSSVTCRKAPQQWSQNPLPSLDCFPHFTQTGTLGSSLSPGLGMPRLLAGGLFYTQMQSPNLDSFSGNHHATR